MDFNGKVNYKWSFSIAMLNYQRVSATVNIWNIAPSHQFLKSVKNRVQVLVYKQMLSFFEECIILFQAPAQFQKKRCLEYYSPLNFGCSSYKYLAILQDINIIILGYKYDINMILNHHWTDFSNIGLKYESFKFHRNQLSDRSDESSPDPHLLSGAWWRERHIDVGLGQLLGKLVGLWMFMAQTSLELNILG